MFPKEGPIFWHDNMCIPIRAQHPNDAITYMDYVFRPEVAGTMADSIWFVSPVPAAKDYVLNQLKDPDVGNSPLVFPSAEDLAQAKGYKIFKSPDEEDQWKGVWEPVFSS